jgi:TP901 family phage tail tape measure protein
MAKKNEASTDAQINLTAYLTLNNSQFVSKMKEGVVIIGEQADKIQQKLDKVTKTYENYRDDFYKRLNLESTQEFSQARGEMQKMPYYKGLETQIRNLTAQRDVLKEQISPENVAGLNTQKFKGGLKTLNEKWDIRAKIGMNAEQYNRALWEMGKALGVNNVEIMKYMKLAPTAEEHMKKIFDRAVITIPVWMALRTAVQLLTRAFSEGLKFIAEYEESLANIQISSNESKENVRALGDAVLALASKYGVVGGEALKAAKLFAQQGLSLSSTLEMTSSAIQGSQLLEESVTTVAEGLTSAIRAYNLNANDSISIIDKWMKVQKDFAVSANDLEEGMKTAGATASAFGIDIDTLNGHLVGIIEATRKTGSQAGNALVMMYTRLFTTAKDYIQSIAKVSVYLDRNGKATMENTNHYRKAGDVLDDVAISWKNLDGAEKLNLATQIGSRRNSTSFIALMENYDRVLKAEISSLGSAGTSMEAMKIKQDTVLYKTKQLTSSWQELMATIGNTSVWKGTIDILAQLVRQIEKVISASEGLKGEIRREASGDIARLNAEEERYKNLDALLALQKKLKETGTYPELLPKLEATISNLRWSPDTSSKREEIPKKRLEKQVYELKPELEPDYQRRLAGEKVKSSVQELFAGISLLALLSSKSAQTAIAKSGNIAKLGTIAGATAGAGLIVKGTVDMTSGVFIGIKESLKSLIPGWRKAAETQRTTIVTGEEKKITDEEQLNKLLKVATDLQEKEELNDKQLVQRIDNRAKLMQITGASEQEILKYKIAQYEAEDKLNNVSKYQLEITQMQGELEQKNLQDIYEYSNKIQTSLSGGIKNIMSGTGGLKDVFKGIQDTMVDSYRTTVSDELAKGIMNISGFGEMFGKSMLTLKGQIEVAHKTVYDLIVRGHKDGAEAVKEAYGVSGGKIGPATLAQISANAGWSGSSGASSTFGGMGGGFLTQGINTALNRPLFSSQSGLYGVAGGRIGPARQGQGGGVTGGGLAGSALMGYSAYQSARAGGITRGQSIASGVLTGVGALGIMAGVGMLGVGAGAAAGVAAGGLGIMGGLAAIGPLGWAAIGVMVLGMALGMFGGKKSSQTSVETRTTENAISSKINVTNKNLEIINRNLIGLRTDIRSYILPQSAYFSTKRNLDDEFSLMSRRGYQG